MCKLPTATIVLACCLTADGQAQENVLFEDSFDDGLADKWQLVGLDQSDYRLKDGGLELRVHPGRDDRETPMLKVVLPFSSADDVTASVDVQMIQPFTEPEEYAGLFLIDEHGREFRATKQLISGQLMYSPPRVDFLGEPGTEDDFSQYAFTYRPVSPIAGPLRIHLSGNYAYYQVGPSPQGKYLNFFFSAIRKQSRERGFCLSAAGAPADEVHWVRFDNFRVTRN